jgi:hypothetical protein
VKRAAIKNLATGFVPDFPDLDLPAGAWTDSRNVQYRDGAAEKCPGYASALGSLSATAIFAAPISDGVNYFWVYGSETAMYATDGTNHADIEGSITLGASSDLGYTGGAFNGFMVINDGVGIPQSWVPSLSNDLVSLTAWPAVTLIAKVVRPWRDFLIALRITDGGTYNPRLMRWSDVAQVGALPGSWDFTDPTNQSGIKDFGQTEDQLIDCAPLRDSLIVYKENHVWQADYVGGLDILSFRQIFSQVGAMTENCIATIGAQHLVLGTEDLILHDGNSAKSLLDKRARRWFFNRINTLRHKRSFISVDHANRQAYICIPESGRDWPSLALVWNWAEDTIHPYDLGGPKTFGSHGIVTTGTPETFDGASGTIDSEVRTFDEETFSPFDRKMVLLDAQSKKLFQFPKGETYDGVTMSCYAQRLGSAITEDLGMIKRVWRIWPQLIGTTGDMLNFWIGARENLSSDVAFTGPYPFVIGTDTWIDVRLDARVIDLRFEYAGTGTFRLHGMLIDYEGSGER